MLSPTIFVLAGVLGEQLEDVLVSAGWIVGIRPASVYVAKGAPSVNRNLNRVVWEVWHDGGR
jgi:hypothetical protein